MTAQAAPNPSINATVYSVLFAAAGCHLINDTMQAIMLAAYPLLQQNYGLTFTQIGLMTFAFQGTGSVLQPFIGFTTDKKPWPLILPLAPAFTLLGFILLATAHSYPPLLLGAISIGIGSAMFHPDASRVARYASGGKYGMAQSLFQVGGNIGTSLGPLCAAWFVLPYGQKSILWLGVLAMLSFTILSFVAKCGSPRNNIDTGKTFNCFKCQYTDHCFDHDNSVAADALKICIYVQPAQLLFFLHDG
jgi:MFS transporter, FSR family, fosmidomycin resistance protein